MVAVVVVVVARLLFVIPLLVAIARLSDVVVVIQLSVVVVIQLSVARRRLWDIVTVCRRRGH